jgi:uncharacterized protein (TIGR02678 family)
MRPDRSAGRASHSIRERQQQVEHDEFRAAVRALLMTPLMSPGHEDFAAVRRHAEPLRDWCARETGWVLHVEREGARLYKRPADLTDATRGLRGYGRGRYVLLCLACAVLERADPQITLRVLGERVLQLAAEPALAELDFTFTLGSQNERRDLVTVCRTLLDLGVLQRVAGDEESFVQASGDHADALYDVHRRMLAGMLAAVRGPSTWAPEEAPANLESRLLALVGEHVADSEEGRRTALRHTLARQMLDDPVIYTESLDPQVRAYFINQRGAMAARLCEATGLVPEQRAEGLALADFLRAARGDFGHYWRRSAREPGTEHELAAIAIERLEKLRLLERNSDGIRPRPALARFALGEADIEPFGGPGRAQPNRRTETP